jgi:hypothetical protein
MNLSVHAATIAVSHGELRMLKRIDSPLPIPVEGAAPKYFPDFPRPPVGYSIQDLVRLARVGRTMVFAEIKVGNLKARKIGRRTIILDEDLRRWLASLPTREVA